MKPNGGWHHSITRSLAGKLIAIFFLFGIIPLGTLSLLFFLKYFQDQQASVISIQRELAENVARSISYHLEGTKSQIQLFANFLDLETMDDRALQRLLFQFLDQSLQFNVIAVVDGEGRERSKVSRYYTFRPHEMDRVFDHPSFHVASAGKTWVGPVEISRFNSFPEVHISAPLYNAYHQIRGVLNVGLNVSGMWELISKHRIGEDRCAYVLDGEGKLIAYQDGASVLEERTVQGVQAMRPFLDGEPGPLNYRGLSGKTVVGVSARISPTNWIVVVEEPLEKAFRELYLLSAAFLGIFGVTVSFAVFFGLKFSFGNIIRPIRELQNRTVQIARGNFHQPIETVREDELGHLAAALNSMSAELRATTVSRDLLLKEIDEKRKAEASILSHRRFEALITNLSTRFITLPSQFIDEGIRDALSAIGSFTEADRSYVFQFTGTGDTMDNTHEWCAPGIQPYIEQLQGIPVDELDWLVAPLKRSQTVYIPSVAAMPPEADREREHLQMQGIQSLALVPMVFEQHVIGFLGLDWVRGERDWSEETASLLKIAGEMFANALHRKQTEEALRAGEERLRTITENVPVGIALVRGGGELIYCNPSFADIMGFREAEPCSPSPSAGLDASTLMKCLEGSVDTGPYKEITATIGTPAGEERQVYARSVTMPDGIQLLTLQDITEHRRLETRLRQSHKMEAIGTLAGGIAHDFNNILSPILGYAEMALMELPEGSRLQRNLEQILKSAHRAKDLVKQILAYSRQTEQEKRPVRIAQVVEETLTFLRASLPSTIDILAQTGEGAGESMVMADPVQINQVLMNLCTNAGHAMRERGGTLRVALENLEIAAPLNFHNQTLAAGRYVRISVEDSGVGMDDTVQQRIFDPYFTTKQSGEGTGMGLTIVYGIVQAYRGAVTFNSKPGQGTVFHVFLPRLETHIESPQDASPSIPGGSGRILVVDDEPALVEMMEEMLHRLGYQVTACNSSPEALEMIRRQPYRFDLVVTDQTMPKLTGLELAREALALNPRLPVILCSGFNKQPEDREVAATGIVAMLNKPVAFNELARAVEKSIKRNRPPEAEHR